MYLPKEPSDLVNVSYKHEVTLLSVKLQTTLSTAPKSGTGILRQLLSDGPLFKSGPDNFAISRNLYFSIIRNLTSLCKKNLYLFGAKARDVTPDFCALLLNREERSTNTLFYFKLQSHKI